jgi:hypothetical protein
MIGLTRETPLPEVSVNRIAAASTVLCSLVTVLLLAACAGTPEDRVARLRGMYSARLNGFIVEQPPAPEPLMMEEEEGEEPMAPVEEAAEEPMEPMEPEPMGPQTHDIRLDILIQHDSPERLPGVTVDISMVDGAGAEKGAWKVWFDTANMPKANVTQYTHLLEDVPYEEGDGFYAEIRHPIPAAERGEYREFSAAG